MAPAEPAWLVVGLGNPGTRYEFTRHNAGARAVERLAKKFGARMRSTRAVAHMGEALSDGVKLYLARPTTYMNESGRAVGEAARFLKLATSDIVVFHDELDLLPGKLKIKSGGGNAGHNGLRSITAHLDNEYARVRIGIGHPGVKELVHNHVLGDFAKADAIWLDPLLDAIADNAGLLAKGDDSSFMNKITLATGGGSSGSAPAQKSQSHIRQARQIEPPKLPESGPMAAMLKRLFGNKE